MNGDASVPVAIGFAGSEPALPSVRECLPAGADVIAADSGLRVANALGLHVHLLVGELHREVRVGRLGRKRDAAVRARDRERLARIAQRISDVMRVEQRAEI